MRELNIGTGQRLYEEAKTILPGGTQLLSKRPELFLPQYWPAYYSRAKGCRVWDLDGNEYIDMSYMGVGANVLGYAHEEVDEAAREAIRNGGMCTLNAPEEVYLARVLLDLHPWAESVRYAKTGGEAAAMAVRIARACTGREKVLFCGYHGWHDWYLSANLASADALNDHHIAGLVPAGVPSGLAGTSLPFHYNDPEEFLKRMRSFGKETAAVIMEPIRNDPPRDGFLQLVRAECDKYGVVLIFDEISAGFRLCPGGSHLRLGVCPDMAVFAKGMSNGYPLSAVIGARKYMEAAQDTFISSTYFTERVALAAALKTIEVYRRDKVWEKQQDYGHRVQQGWEQLGQQTGLSVQVGGIAPLAHFTIRGKQPPRVYKTFYTQQMLKYGYLATNAFYASAAHSESVIREYLDCTRSVFRQIAQVEQEGRDLQELLQGPVCSEGFARLN